MPPISCNHDQIFHLNIKEQREAREFILKPFLKHSSLWKKMLKWNLIVAFTNRIRNFFREIFKFFSILKIVKADSAEIGKERFNDASGFYPELENYVLNMQSASPVDKRNHLWMKNRRIKKKVNQDIFNQKIYGKSQQWQKWASGWA